MARSARIPDMYRTHRFRRPGALFLLFSSPVPLDGLLAGRGTHADRDPDNGAMGPGTDDPGSQNSDGQSPDPKTLVSGIGSEPFPDASWMRDVIAK